MWLCPLKQREWHVTLASRKQVVSYLRWPSLGDSSHLGGCCSYLLTPEESYLFYSDGQQVTQSHSMFLVLTLFIPALFYTILLSVLMENEMLQSPTLVALSSRPLILFMGDCIIQSIALKGATELFSWLFEMKHWVPVGLSSVSHLSRRGNSLNSSPAYLIVVTSFCRLSPAMRMWGNVKVTWQLLFSQFLCFVKRIPPKWQVSEREDNHEGF